MPNLTIKNVPAPLLRKLKSRAASQRRSLNSEVIACLETFVQPTPVDAEALLAEARAVRITPKRPVTDRMLNRFKRAGRL